MKSITSTACTLIALTSLSLLTAQNADQSEPFFKQVGLRGGFDEESDVSVWSAEVFGIIDTDWDWDLSQSVRMDLNFETSVGVWETSDETVGLIHFAPELRFFYKDLPVSLSLSSGPTLISEDELSDDHDMGGFFQFTSSIGLRWAVTDQFELGYSYQHTSNAGIYSENDGLNMHAFSAAYTF